MIVCKEMGVGWMVVGDEMGYWGVCTEKQTTR